jgi:hypothetical protein
VRIFTHSIYEKLGRICKCPIPAYMPYNKGSIPDLHDLAIVLLFLEHLETVFDFGWVMAYVYEPGWLAFGRSI